MKKIIGITFLLITLSCANTKRTDSKQLANVTKYISSISESKLKEHLLIVASDEMEGRETGSEGQKKAGNYLIDQYKKNNIPFPKGATSYYQEVPAAFLKTRSCETLNASENIWAFIEGSEKPDEIVVVSAHYDHIGTKNGAIFNGADDDGSGTVALIEIAKAFQQAKKSGHGPKRSILILHVTGEEHGLLGSKYYSEHPLFPLTETVSDINIDMIGRRDTDHPSTNNYVYVIGADRLSSDLHNIVVAANKKHTNLDLDFKFNDPADPNHIYERSDHYNFAKYGIPSVFFFNGIHADYHKASDTVDKIEFDALAKRTQLAFAVAWEVANRENKLVVDK